MLDKLNERFKPTEVKSRLVNPRKAEGPGNPRLHYIDIATTIGRLNAVAGLRWGWVITDSSLERQVNPPLPDGSFGGAVYVAQVRGELTIYDGDVVTTRGGVGADADPNDPDKAVKTATAEALKKASHLFGVGLYLWDEGERDEVVRSQAAAGGDLKILKNMVATLCVEQGGTIESGATIAAHFGVDEAQLQDAGTLAEILQKHGRL